MKEIHVPEEVERALKALAENQKQIYEHLSENPILSAENKEKARQIASQWAQVVDQL